MREIVLDTETTGLSPQNGDRIVEIGCIELLNKVPTTNNFHQYRDSITLQISKQRKAIRKTLK